MKKGVFWLINGELLTFPFDGKYPEGTAKSGDTYNHQKLWEIIRPKDCKKLFDYYPRGRVDISNKGKAVIYMSVHIGEEFVPKIKSAFEISGDAVIRYDHCRHYMCYLDR
ncbi:hypothetical protein [Ruminococcus albus]|uniref:Uncharacterized protein n=1 Tax=Ruminococcus albus (strain ATCC 27210 / DSM 20455 / JCM 14654 / NCDO 2250 / 7) TaxID=697329 RepID=E6UCN6_RUMA7|nr:hypothetical protein [Ruminococcus albus]ADU21641.1 hypothetical protein Rumal_1116 [Ruminococcus albus 7 = DSM 20455]